MMLLAATVELPFGCGAERLNGGLDAATLEPAGSGGAGFGTGGSGTGGDGTGGDGTGGDATGGSGGTARDAAPEVAPTTEAGDARDASTSAEDTASGGRDALDGTGDAIGDAAACVNGTRDLSNVGTGNFHISFRIETTQTGWVALLNQRSTCSFGVFWDIRQTANGTLSVETDDNVNGTYRRVDSTVKINDGNLHEIEVARVSGTLTLQIDGAQSGTMTSPASLGALPALRIGADVCDAAGSNPLTAAFAGKTLSDVCITKR